MPRTDWQAPMYERARIVEMETHSAGPDHPDGVVKQWAEHILMLTFQKNEHGGRDYWGVVWLARNGDDPWHQVVLTSGASPDDGDAERRLIRQYREQITGRVSR